MQKTALDIKQVCARYVDELIELRRDFHMYPELGYQEFRTAEKVEHYLQALGLTTERVTGTGVVAVIEGEQPGKTLMLRADMDALPIQEDNDVPYRSKNDGVMHACAHDGHTAMLMIAAKILWEHRDLIAGRVKLVFQPNEEVAGAQAMIEAGVLESPRVDAAMGLHIWTPVPIGQIGVKPGTVMASMDVFKLVLNGHGGHTGYPETAIDPVVAAANIIQSVQTIQTREMGAQNSTAIMFAKLAAGTKNNIIPDTVTLEGSMRYLYPDSDDPLQNPPARFERIVKGICDAHRLTYNLEVARENSALVNDPDMAHFAAGIAAQVLGSPADVVEHASMAGEDFSAFAYRVPSVFCFIGTGNPAKETDFPHHNPRFNIDEDSLLTGVEMHVRGALTYLNGEEVMPVK